MSAKDKDAPSGQAKAEESESAEDSNESSSQETGEATTGESEAPSSDGRAEVAADASDRGSEPPKADTSDGADEDSDATQHADDSDQGNDDSDGESDDDKAEAAPAAIAKSHSGAPAAGHHSEHEYPYVAHHFDSPQQQLESGKLGVWLFLTTEILFFAGLFCAYTIYRAQHPEVFYWAHFFLDTKLGALNTMVLILSSLTAAWAVRNAQLGQKAALVRNILITIACACTFMVVKYVEYSHKIHDGLLPGKHFNNTHQVWEVETFKSKHPEAAAAAARLAVAKAEPAKSEDSTAKDSTEEVLPAIELSALEREPLEAAGVLKRTKTGDYELTQPKRAPTFFGVYFFMTGLHGLHVLIGIGIWVWLLLRARKGQFGPLYFGPIDFAALYWHLVDLIWIYLFPLLYLIH